MADVLIEVFYSTDDASDTTPTWVQVPASDLREYSVSRGRSTELDEIDAATATIVLNNRSRTYDPNVNALLGPMNRWWVRTTLSGETQDRFKGYADRYALAWPEKGKDSVVTVYCSDELKILNLVNLPVTDPPRDTYQDLVLADDPSGYWPCDDAATQEIAGVVGDAMTPMLGGITNYTSGPIVGAVSDSGNYSLSASQVVSVAGSAATASENPVGDVSSLGQFTVEFWTYITATPAAEEQFLSSPMDDTTTEKWSCTLDTAGKVWGHAFNSASTGFHVSSTALTGSTWYHFVWTLLGGTLTLYRNAVSQGTTAFSGSFDQTLDAVTPVTTMGLESALATGQRFAHVAFYRAGFSSGRVTAHYNAGVSRGFPAQLANDRIDDVLDAVSNAAPRSLRTASRSVTPRSMHGQSALEAMKDAAQAEQVSAMLFVGRDGTITFLDSAHRSASPWNTVQIVFDDDGTDSSYWDTDQDLSEAFLFNEWNVTREGGALQTASDATSVSRYGKRSQSLSVPVTSDAAANDIATLSLALYKNPMARIPTVEPNMANTAVAVLVLRRELGHKIRIIRRPLGGGAAIDQQSWIQSIQETGSPGVPLRVVFGVSPR